MMNDIDKVLYEKFSLLTINFVKEEKEGKKYNQSQTMDKKISQIVSKTDEQIQQKAELRTKRKTFEQQFDPGF